LDVQDFLELFPEFDTKNVNSDLIELYMRTAQKQCRVEVWGDPEVDSDSLRNEAILYLTAHRYLVRLETMARLAAIAAGADGGTMPQPGMIETDLKTTSYGAFYLDMASRLSLATGFPL
jgi:hypothetical protein